MAIFENCIYDIKKNKIIAVFNKKLSNYHKNALKVKHGMIDFCSNSTQSVCGKYRNGAIQNKILLTTGKNYDF